MVCISYLDMLYHYEPIKSWCCNQCVGCVHHWDMLSQIKLPVHVPNQNKLPPSGMWANYCGNRQLRSDLWSSEIYTHHCSMHTSTHHHLHPLISYNQPFLFSPSMCSSTAHFLLCLLYPCIVILGWLTFHGTSLFLLSSFMICNESEPLVAITSKQSKSNNLNHLAVYYFYVCGSHSYRPQLARHVFTVISWV